MILSQTGTFIQMSSRNILASPSTLGFDGLSILWILVIHSLLLLIGYDQPVLSLLAIGIPFFIALGFVFTGIISKSRNIEKLVLIGLTFNLLVGAIFSLWQFLFLAFNLPFPVELWFGHFRYANGEALSVLMIVEILICFGLFILRRELAVFSLGKSVSKNLNIDQKKLYRFLFISVSLGTFCVIAFFGAFSFLALIFPIMARKLWFNKFDLQGEYLLGALMNGCLLMMIDFGCYFFPIFGAEIPVGLIATAIGALSLIFLLWKSDSHLEILAKTRN